MFGLFKPKEVWRVGVTKAFTDLHVGMLSEEYQRFIPLTEKGTAVIKHNGKVIITLDNVRDTPYTRALKIYCFKGDDTFTNFKLLEMLK